MFLPVIPKGVAVQMAVVEAQTAAECPMLEALAGGGEDADVEEVVGGNEVLLACVPRLLVHATDAGIKLPTLEGVVGIAGIVSEGVEEEVEAGAVVGFFVIPDGETVGHGCPVVVFLLEFLAAVVLVADDGLEETVAEGEGVVEDSFVMADLLIG